MAHELPFNNTDVMEAADIMSEVWFNPNYVFGGTTGILTIVAGDTQTPMFEVPPGLLAAPPGRLDP